MARISRIWLWAILSALMVAGCEKAPQARLVDIPDGAFMEGLVAAGVDWISQKTGP